MMAPFAGSPEEHLAFVRTALSEASLGIAFVDTDLRVLWANAALGAGAPPGPTLAALLPSARPTAEDIAREVLQSGTPRRDVALVPLARAAGDAVRHWSLSVWPVRNADGALLGACCLCTDIGERVQLAEQFVQAQKLESVGLLANVIAHDFNNLLSVIQGYCDLLLRDASDAAKRHARLSEVRNAAAAAGHLSKQLLTLSRRNVGSRAPVDVNLLVRAISRMLDRILPANVAHDLMLAEDLGLILADPGQVDQLLMNLITNAIDAMSAGGLLTVETANTTVAAGEPLAPGEYVSIIVRDTGIGMDAPTLAQIFDPCFSTKSADRATGVGLPAVRRIVEQLHGDVSVESEVGKGSTFTVRLPRVPATRGESSPSPIAIPGVRPSTILVVEDHPELRQALITELETVGYLVLAAGSGGAAVRVAAEHSGPIDLLLADIELPDTHGAQLAEQLRTARPGLRVLMTSGFGEQALPAGDLSGVCHAVLGKPFTMIDLVRTIERTLYPTAAPGAPITAR